MEHLSGDALNLIRRLIESIRESYISLTQQFIDKAIPYHQESLYISHYSLGNALKDIETDIRFLLMRRPVISSLMRGKIAGVILFRLSKYHILHLSEQLLNDKLIAIINTQVAILLAFRYININFDLVPERIRNEIIFSVSKRHMNQETLGIVLDTLRMALNDEQ